MEIFISSGKCNMFIVRDICVLLPYSAIQVYPFTCRTRAKIEPGFHIKFIECPSIEDIRSIWNILSTKLSLHCAYVKKPGSYEGCISNWPGVFVKSKCLSKL